MNNNKVVLNFLTKLSENNSKEWMDANRALYTTAKDLWLDQVRNILALLSKHDYAYFSQFDPKNCISRITNNRMYNPNLPIYKDFFTFSIMDKSDFFSPLHISVGVTNSFIGCGYHSPDKQTLKNIRDAIDYDGQSLKDILEDKKFKNFYGGLNTFTDPLKTSPQGFTKDHPYVEYLRFKSYTALRNLSKDEIEGDDFMKIIEEAYVLSEPLRGYLKRANSV